MPIETNLEALNNNFPLIGIPRALFDLPSDVLS